MLDFFFYVSAMAFVGKTSPSNDGSHWKWIVFVHASEMNNPTFERAPITESVFTLKLLSTRTSSRALFDDYAALIRHEIYLHDGIRVYRGRTVVMHVEWKIHWTFFRTTFDVLRYYLGINKFFFFFFFSMAFNWDVSESCYEVICIIHFLPFLPLTLFLHAGG